MGFQKTVSYMLLILVGLLGIRLLSGGLVPQPVTAPQGEVKSVFVVYFAAQQDTELVGEYRMGDGSITERLQALVAGPHSQDLLPVLPPGTQVLDYQQQNDLLIINFSAELVNNHPGGSSGELITVYGIVNTLTEVTTVNRVQILVEGRMLESLAGHIGLMSPLEKDRSLIVSERLL